MWGRTRLVGPGGQAAPVQMGRECLGGSGRGWGVVAAVSAVPRAV